MYRCASAALAAAFLCATAQAQAPQRNFPATALRGTLAFGVPPQVRIDDQAARLAPGARVRGADNLLQLPGTLSGQRFVVHYTLDLQGLVSDVWILREEEAAKKPWPRTLAEARSWSFDASSQTWTRP